MKSQVYIFVAALMVIFFIATPSARAQFDPVTGGLLSFGGRVTAIVPCISPLGPSIWFTLVQTPPKQPSLITLIWTPLTVTMLAGPPHNPGQQVLGRFDTPFVCFVPGPHGLLPLPPGFRITLMGSSPIL